MVAYLLGKRVQPAVGVACSTESGNMLSRGSIRTVVGPRARVYFVRGDVPLNALSRALGLDLTVSRGTARIWWPGLTVMSDPADHPEVILSGCGTLEEFARAFDLSRPRVRAALRRRDDMRLCVEQELGSARGCLRQVGQDLRDAQLDHLKAIGRAEVAEAALRPLAEQADQIDVDERLHTLISLEWLATLTAPDRRKHPLKYILAAGFVDIVERQLNLSLDALAWTTAMIASAYEPALRTIEPHPRADEAGAPIYRDDGAAAMTCAINQRLATTARLLYWNRPTGLVEFDSIETERTTSQT